MLKAAARIYRGSNAQQLPNSTGAAMPAASHRYLVWPTAVYAVSADQRACRGIPQRHYMTLSVERVYVLQHLKDYRQMHASPQLDARKPALVGALISKES